ncbi:MAG: formyl transferase [Gammaproteobacteria bacterium]
MEQQLFNQLLFPLIDSTPARSTARFKTFNGLAALTEGPIEDLNGINGGADLERFANTDPDLVLSIRYGKILKEQVIALPRLGILNLHSGRLPAYRGVMASFWAMLNGEDHLATTLHYIDSPSIDTGPVLGFTELRVQPGKSYLWHVLNLYHDACALLAARIDQLEENIATPAESQHGAGTYYSFPTMAQLEQFEQRGFLLFDPSDVIDIAKSFTPPSGAAN